MLNAFFRFKADQGAGIEPNGIKVKIFSTNTSKRFTQKKRLKSMKGSETKFVSYMQGSDKRFVIPVYQRNYDWKTENCKQLYDDLIKVIRRGRKSHFFGSIVSVHNDGEFNEYLVIDGQQRLTTVSLLLLAMYNLMKNGVLTPERSNLAEKIYKTYLIDEWQDDDTRIKLKPVKNDRNAFDKLFDKESEHILRILI